MLLNKKYVTRSTTHLGLVAMLLLLALAWHFYLERVAYYDLAYHVFTFLRPVFVDVRLATESTLARLTLLHPAATRATALCLPHLAHPARLL